MIRDFAPKQWAALDKALLDAAAAHGIHHYGIAHRWAGEAIIVYADRLDDSQPTVLFLHYGRHVGQIIRLSVKDAVAALKRESGAD